MDNEKLLFKFDDPKMTPEYSLMRIATALEVIAGSLGRIADYADSVTDYAGPEELGFLRIRQS